MRTPADRMEELLAAEAEGRLPALLPFWGHEAAAGPPGPWVLSQWWEAPFEVDGVRYATAEAFMMAEKAGRLVTPFDPEVWSAHAYGIVVRGNVAKFGAHDDLRAYLLSTAPKVLVEASPRDRVWGIGLGPKNPAAHTPSAWRGRNLLGFALMDARERLS